ncbi:MAG: ribonuclease P protein component [Oscillospiraceae bacterium]|jgi:ribonuclease P protein component|nr:ribonuclease P protein component [Oscillospiraceae bacterium]
MNDNFLPKSGSIGRGELPSQKLPAQRKNYVSVSENREFQYLFKKGENLVTYAFVCYYKPNRRRTNRLGVTASKKIGNAVKRNRARRIIKEAFRLANPLFIEKTDKRHDFVFVARGKTPELGSKQIYGLLIKQLLPRLPGRQ